MVQGETASHGRRPGKGKGKEATPAAARRWVALRLACACQQRWAIRQQLAGRWCVSVAMGARWPVARGPEANYGKCVSGPGPGPAPEWGGRTASLAIARVFSSPRGRSLSGITHGTVRERRAGRKQAMAPSGLQTAWLQPLSATVAAKLPATSP